MRIIFANRGAKRLDSKPTAYKLSQTLLNGKLFGRLDSIRTITVVKPMANYTEVMLYKS